MAPAGDARLLRTLPSGIKLMVREAAVNRAWRRPNIEITDTYLSDVIGKRVEEEAPQQIIKVEKKTGKKVDRVVIECDIMLQVYIAYVTNRYRDTFHESSGDIVSHAGVTYEDVAGTHLSKKHVAEQASDQAKVSVVLSLLNISEEEILTNVKSDTKTAQK